MGAVVALCGCTDESLAPADLAGVYPFSQINGHAAGWYHPLAGENCDVAFTGGSLTIDADGSFRLDVAYDYRCFNGNGTAGSSALVVTGTSAQVVDESLTLSGCGPPVGFPENCPRWALSVRPALPMLTVTFQGDAGAYWGNPVLTMGPRQE